MPDEHQPQGKTTVSPQVLIAIARMAALSVPGVSSMAPVAGGVDRLFRRRLYEGIRITLEDGVVSGDIHLIIKHDVNIREVSRNVQEHVARAIREMVGMDVARLEVHVENIDYEVAEA